MIGIFLPSPSTGKERIEATGELTPAPYIHDGRYLFYSVMNCECDCGSVVAERQNGDNKFRITKNGTLDVEVNGKSLFDRKDEDTYVDLMPGVYLDRTKPHKSILVFHDPQEPLAVSIIDTVNGRRREITQAIFREIDDEAARRTIQAETVADYNLLLLARDNDLV